MRQPIKHAIKIKREILLSQLFIPICCQTIVANNKQIINLVHLTILVAFLYIGNYSLKCKNI